MELSRLDKEAISLARLGDASDLKTFWHSRTPGERLEAMEEMRRVNYGKQATSGRLQRVLTVTQQERR